MAQTSHRTAHFASLILADRPVTKAQIKKVAASALRQAEHEASAAELRRLARYLRKSKTLAQVAEYLDILDEWLKPVHRVKAER